MRCKTKSKGLIQGLNQQFSTIGKYVFLENEKEGKKREPFKKNRPCDQRDGREGTFSFRNQIIRLRGYSIPRFEKKSGMWLNPVIPDVC